MTAGPDVHRALAAALDRALAPTAGPGPVAHFVNDVARGEVCSAVRHCLPPGGADAFPRLVRVKLKPGRTLKAEYDVVLPTAGPGRRIAVTWVVPGATAPGPAPDQEREARRRGVLAPFRRSWIGSADERMSVSVAPVDGAFPQLVRLHDRAHLAGVLGRCATGTGDAATDDLGVETVRYRPGQRHVLRIGRGATGPAWYAKVYRDDTGRRAVDGAARAFAAAGDGAVAAAPGAGTYVAADRTALWPEASGRSLAETIAFSGPAPVDVVRIAGDVVRTAGTVLRLVHDAAPAEGLPDSPDAAAQAAATLRTAKLVDVLVPAAGSRLGREVGRALDSLVALPVEATTMTHGDYKCDNLLVGPSRVCLVDFDRVGRGDPAADIGKFLADLRWWTDGDGPAAAGLHRAFLEGYGGTAAVRVARARLYDGLFQLRMAARRVPVQAPDYEPRVVRAVGIAAATLAEVSEP